MAEMIFSRKYAAGEVIFRVGEDGRDAYVIESGRVQVTLPGGDGDDGDEVVIAELGPGEIFGEMPSPPRPRPPSKSVCASSPSLPPAAFGQSLPRRLATAQRDSPRCRTAPDAVWCHSNFT